MGSSCCSIESKQHEQNNAMTQSTNIDKIKTIVIMNRQDQPSKQHLLTPPSSMLIGIDLGELCEEGSLRNFDNLIDENALIDFKTAHFIEVQLSQQHIETKNVARSSIVILEDQKPITTPLKRKQSETSVNKGSRNLAKRQPDPYVKLNTVDPEPMWRTSRYARSNSQRKEWRFDDSRSERSNTTNKPGILKNSFKRVRTFGDRGLDTMSLYNRRVRFEPDPNSRPRREISRVLKA